MIAVVKNTGGTNLNSVCHALERIDATYCITDDASVMQSADKVILPGVGAAAHAMNKLQTADLVTTIRGLTQPVMGICLGMQLLFEHSQEGDTACIGVIPGRVTALEATTPSIRIPHMGWNKLIGWDADYALCQGLPKDSYVYFVHSYAATTGAWVKAHAEYGQPIPAIIQHRNFFGCQFHPEKSALVGEMILRNFIQLEHIP